MKHNYLIPIYLLIIFVIGACGKKTAPVPYEQPELALPKIKVQQPNYHGSWLRINWEIDLRSEDLEGTTYFLKVFRQTETCRYCQTKAFYTVEFSPKDTDKEGSILFRSSGKTYSVLFKESIHSKWQTLELHYFTLGYRLSSGLISEDSEKIRPIKAERIPKPKITIVKQNQDDISGKMNIILRWTKPVERIYRTVHKNNFGREVTQYYGVNLYQSDQPDQLILSEKLNDHPLISGFANVSFQKSRLYAAHVDRFGNESERIIVTEVFPENQ